jgi:hypothetical protein
MLLTNNFMPLLVMPTRITSNSATLIDHVYYYEGLNAREHISVKSGNFLEDITDHLPSYVLVISNRHNMYCKRLMVRLFSEKILITSFANFSQLTGHWFIISQM